MTNKWDNFSAMHTTTIETETDKIMMINVIDDSIGEVFNAGFTFQEIIDRSNPLEKKEYSDLVLKLIKEGDILTHTRCMGCIEEHFYTGMDGNWICGSATAATLALGQGFSDGSADDISPLNVTHINHVPVEAVEFLADMKGNNN